MNIYITQRNDLMAQYFKAPVKKSVDAPTGNAASSDAIKAQMDAYQKRCDESRQTIAEMRSSEQQMAQWKKADAAQKIQQLKDQIRMLRIMGGISDPTSNLRQISQLSKELATAAREYASACTDISAASATSDTSDTTANTKAADAAHASEPAIGTTNLTGGTERNTSMQAEPKGLSPTQESSVTEADRKFAAEVINLANQLKSLAKQQEMRLQQRATPSNEGERAKIYEAFADIEKSLTTILTPAQAAPLSINIFA